MEKQEATMKITLFFVLSIHLVASQNLVADNRCFLESGSSSESFFVPEDQPVGSTIGQVRIVGDPRPGGNVALRLKEADGPVSIAPGTKNLTLKRRLDKEGLEGPSSVFVNLICERLRTLDPGFVIPINIRVTDANDNSPIFVNAPYVLNISEVTVVGTRVLQGVHAVDNDQQGPFSNVRYSVIPGLHSDYFEFENELEGTLVLKKPLDYETLETFDVHIRAQDHGEPPRTADTVLTVYVMDADDQNPRFLDDRYTAVLQSGDLPGTVLKVQPKDIKAYDQDKGLNAPVYYTFNGLTPDYNLFKINRKTGKVILAKNISESALLHPATLVIRATQEDNPDRYALATLTVTRNVNSGIQFLHDVFFVSVVESTPQGTVVGTLANNRPGQNLKYFVSDQNILKTFALNTKGELSLKKRLDYEERPEYFFKVFATDGITNDSSVVNITVVDVNEWEPRFRYPHYEFYASGAPKELLGKIEAADGDKNDKITLTLTGANASSFFITPMGELRLRDEARRTSGSAIFEVVATDNGNPPREARVPVTVHFPGDENSASVGAKRGGAGTSALLAGLGASLMMLAVVVAFLIAYIYRSKRNSRRELPTLKHEKNSCSSPMSGKMSNPVFNDRLRNPTATAMGGVPNLATQVAKSTIPSPKVHPAPPPPTWPHSTTSSRVKKLSWGDDKTDSGSSENLDNIDVTPKVMESTNLTVYF